ncbi:hypothetical protein DUZ99_00805 [Xylanibacillus composti]|nr:hypothetical protein [Xylanibacillus composti]
MQYLPPCKTAAVSGAVKLFCRMTRPAKRTAYQALQISSVGIGDFLDQIGSGLDGRATAVPPFLVVQL